MRKLQLRLTQQQTDAIIAALGTAIHLGGNGQLQSEYKRLLPWLIWRRDRVWGVPADAPAAVEPGPLAAAELDRWLADRRRNVTDNL